MTETREEHIQRTANYALSDYVEAMEAFDRGEITGKRRFAAMQRAMGAVGQILCPHAVTLLFTRTFPRETPESVVFGVRDIDTGKVLIGLADHYEMAKDVLVDMRGDFRMEVVLLVYAGRPFAENLTKRLKDEDGGWFNVSEEELELLRNEGIEEDLENIWLQD